MLPCTNLEAYSRQLFSDPDLGLFLDLSHAGLLEESLSELEPRIQSAFTAMNALEEGAVSNPDEHRQVGHYWLRNPELAPNPETAQVISTTLSRIKTFVAHVHAGEICSPAGLPFTHMLVIGIGGSALGPQLLADAFPHAGGLQARFFDNTDPDGMDQVIAHLGGNLPETLVLVISKSGGTAETRNGMLEAQLAFSHAELDFPKHAVAITGEGSQLYQTATNEAWLDIFPMWDWVGGRTSVMSAVGLLPAALQGIDILEFLDGAARMDALTRRTKTRLNPAALLSLAWFILGDGKGSKDMVILPYKDRLLLFSRYLQQLIMESLGKRLDLDGNVVHQGIAVYGNKGSTDQHAYVQQLRDGLNNFFVTFIEVLGDRAGASMLVDGQNTSGDYLFGFHRGTQSALSESDRRSITITIPDVSPRSMGALIALYERAVGLYASMVNINAYHQPGVEAGKKAAGRVLEIKNQVLNILQEHHAFLSVAQIAEYVGLPDEEILIYQILRHHAANHLLQLQGSFSQPDQVKVKL